MPVTSILPLPLGGGREEGGRRRGHREHGYKTWERGRKENIIGGGEKGREREKVTACSHGRYRRKIERKRRDKGEDRDGRREEISVKDNVEEERKGEDQEIKEKQMKTK